MKKRGLLIFGMVAVCSLLIYLVGGMQDKIYKSLSPQKEIASSSGNSSKNTDEETTTPGTKGQNEAGTSTPSGNGSNAASTPTPGNGQNTNNNGGGSGAGSGSNSATPKPVPAATPTPSKPKTEKPNLIITDTISGKVIFSGKVSFNGKSVFDITTAKLSEKGISYKTNITKDYLRSIAGLTEKKPRPESGWIYYINGEKAGIGAKAYIPEEKDIIEWKFLKDAISD